MTKVLFVCVHNSARSQMAEAFLNTLGGGKFEAHSAGLQPGSLNPVVVEAMKDEGIDISGNKTKSVFEMYDRAEQFDYVITVCDESRAEACPTFPGNAKKLHWGFEDPSSLNGSRDDVLARTREIRDAIKAKVIQWIGGLK
ncbi:arsenate reductase ArsC [Candidatus Magnetobacterium casense]|uniref:Arsenate reductase ArsC n=1 Tax=Candidatus Magnetobacterium casense TaxID=1455061 RepID=A0ABS6S284_9BACT|nr:arsenate reductase ArsC [Candidatus Magnetobacterium casensis]MBV6342958.1 arsenate reductase ArsC [Candidatus Magnetobacterium casensis]